MDSEEMKVALRIWKMDDDSAITDVHSTTSENSEFTLEFSSSHSKYRLWSMLKDFDYYVMYQTLEEKDKYTGIRVTRENEFEYRDVNRIVLSHKELRLDEKSEENITTFYENYKVKMERYYPDQDVGILIRNHLKRREVVDKYREFIDMMVFGEQKGIGHRRVLHHHFTYGSKLLFTTLESDYEYSSCKYTGIWDIDKVYRNFKKADREILYQIMDEFITCPCKVCGVK